MKNKTMNFLLFIILILPFLEPLSFKEIIYLDEIYSILKVISFFIILILYILYLKKNQYKMSKILFITIIFQIEIYISTLISNGAFGDLFGQTISVFSVVMLVELYIKKKDQDIVLKSLCGILFCYAVINIFSMLSENPNSGGAIVSFLGMDNRYIFFLLPLCVFSIVYSVLKYNRLTFFTYFVIIISAFQLFYVWSVGAMLAVILLMIFTLLIDKFNIIKKITLKSYLIVIIILNILLVFVQIQYVFEDFIVNYLHKDIDLSGRVYTWKAGIEVFKEHPILGIGGQTANFMQNIYYGTNQHAHNLFLNILVKGGIISLLIQIWMYIEIDKKLRKCDNKKLSAVFAFSIFLILFISLTDTFDTYLVYIIYTLAYYSNDLNLKGRNEYEKNN